MHTPTIPTVDQMFAKRETMDKSPASASVFEDMMQDCRERIVGLGPIPDNPSVPVLTSLPQLE